MVCRIYISQLITEIAKLVNTLPTGKHLLVPMGSAHQTEGWATISSSAFIYERASMVVVCSHALLVSIHNSPSNSNRVLLCKLKDARAVSKVL